MKKAEFDRFADEYRVSHSKVLGPSGEQASYFAEYKVIDIKQELGEEASPATILDFGSGVGNSIPFIKTHFPDSSLVCLDVSKRSSEIAESRFPGQAMFRIFGGDLIPLEDNSVDLVFAACVFHHIDRVDHQPLFREIHRILKPHGNFFVFEHNPLNPLTVKAVRTCEFDANAVLIPGRSMRNAIRLAGFNRSKLKYRIFFPNALRHFRILEPFLVSIPLGAQYFVRAQK